MTVGLRVAFAVLLGLIDSVALSAPFELPRPLMARKRSKPALPLSGILEASTDLLQRGCWVPHGVEPRSGFRSARYIERDGERRPNHFVQSVTEPRKDLPTSNGIYFCCWDLNWILAERISHWSRDHVARVHALASARARTKTESLGPDTTEYDVAGRTAYNDVVNDYQGIGFAERIFEATSDVIWDPRPRQTRPLEAGEVLVLYQMAPLNMFAHAVLALGEREGGDEVVLSHEPHGLVPTTLRATRFKTPVERFPEFVLALPGPWSIEPPDLD